MIDEATLRTLYFDQGLSMRQIATVVHVSAATVSNWLRAYGIPAKNWKEDGRHIWTQDQYPPHKPGDEFSHKSTHIRKAFRTLKKPRQCERCQSTKFVQVHHRDGNHGNNDAANLEVLCRRCHHLAHDTARFLPKDGGWSKRRKLT